MNKKRISLIAVLTLLLFAILVYTLFDITIVQGEYYRNFSDNKRMKQINTTAARGNIYDRNGKLIAGNKPIYSLNVYKDRIDRISKDVKNPVMLNLVHILEEDGVNYLEDFALGIYKYAYKNEADYFLEEKTPNDKVVDIIIENQLMEEILYRSYSLGRDNVYYYPINRAKDYLDMRGHDLPIKINLDGGISIEWDKNESYKNLIENRKITENSSAEEFFFKQVRGNESLAYNMIHHPLTRKIIYEVIKDHGLEDNIVLTELTFSADIDFIENKSILNRYSKEIDMDSDAKSDFIALVKENSLDELLTMSQVDKDKNYQVPAEILINLINSKGIDANVSYEIDKESGRVKLNYVKDTSSEEPALDHLIKLARENYLLDIFIVDSNVVNIAEKSLFNKGIYPRIYKSNWEYSFIKDKRDLLEYNDAEEDATAREVFDKYVERYELQDYSMYESYCLISIYHKIDGQGYLAYMPITLAENINKRTLVEIEENIPKDFGLDVVVQPNRYYPNGSLASHVIGYLGRISEEHELEEYVEYKQYSKNDTVGKTGLEESFEDTLRGSNGRKVVYTNVMGQTTDVIEDIPSVPGNNLYTSLDLDLQKDTEEILRDLIYAMRHGETYHSYLGDMNMRVFPAVESGTAIVMSTKTGEILSMASYPDYNPNLFVNGISTTDWNRLRMDDKDDIYAPRPLLNIATQAAIPPGSTFKTITSLAALDAGWSPHQIITCDQYMDIGDTRFSCLIYTQSGGSHGPLDLYEALRASCNYYFYCLGLGYNPKRPGQLDFKVTVDDIERMVSLLKMDKPTGIEINVPRESSGYSPSVYAKKNLVRTMLRNYLNEKLDKYEKPDKVIRDDQNQENINTLIGLVDRGSDVSRSELVNLLDSMGYEAETPLDGEYAGLADMIKYTYLNQADWTDADSLNMVIGQGQNAYTPMQIARLVSIIANEGVLNKPTLVKEIKNYDNTKTIFKKEVDSEYIEIGDNDNFKHVKEGMRRAAKAMPYRSELPFEVGSKTGTAGSDSIDPKTGKPYRSFAWEMSFSPYDDPEVAVVIMLVQGEHSTTTSIGATDLIYSYFKNVKKDPNFTNERKR